MKARTVKLIIEKRLKQWIETITDEALRKRARNGSIVTGGCIVSLLLNEEVKDFDVYFDSQSLARDMAAYYVTKFLNSPPKAWINADGKLGKSIGVMDRDGGIRLHIKSAGIISEDANDYQYFEGLPDSEGQDFIQDVTKAVDKADEKVVDGGKKEDKDFRPVFMSENAISLSGRIQVVLRFTGLPDEIHKNYDFTHCTNYYHDKKLVLRAEALECILAKELRYQGSLYPICSLFRIRKFMDRGWRISAGQILKIALQISKLDLTDMKALNDQLIGVDAAYFRQLMDKLAEKDPTKVDEGYLINLIDAIA
jgi:hypothetical protein